MPGSKWKKIPSQIDLKFELKFYFEDVVEKIFVYYWCFGISNEERAYFETFLISLHTKRARKS